MGYLCPACHKDLTQQFKHKRELVLAGPMLLSQHFARLGAKQTPCMLELGYILVGSLKNNPGSAFFQRMSQEPKLSKLVIDAWESGVFLPPVIGPNVRKFWWSFCNSMLKQESSTPPGCALFDVTAARALAGSGSDFADRCTILETSGGCSFMQARELHAEAVEMLVFSDD